VSGGRGPASRGYREPRQSPSFLLPEPAYTTYPPVTSLPPPASYSPLTTHFTSPHPALTPSYGQQRKPGCSCSDYRDTAGGHLAQLHPRQEQLRKVGTARRRRGRPSLLRLQLLR
jgi:hypothetical protein